jgi:hypothetical protein
VLWVRYSVDVLFRGELLGVRFDPAEITALLPLSAQASPSEAQLGKLEKPSDRPPLGSSLGKIDHSSMQPAVRSHIRLTLATLHEQVFTGLKDHLESLYSQFGAGNRLHSDAMLKSAFRAIEDHGRQFVASAVDRISGVDQSFQSFAMIEDGFAGFISVLEAEAENATNTAVGNQGSAGHKSNIEKLAAEGLADIRRRLKEQLELHRLPFCMRLGDPPAVQHPSPSHQQPSVMPKNKGGRPRADHWDDLWATIAVRLWTGDFKPKSQADIAKAMHDWLAENELDAGETAVKDRARKLWQKMEASD